MHPRSHARRIFRWLPTVLALPLGLLGCSKDSADEEGATGIDSGAGGTSGSGGSSAGTAGSESVGGSTNETCPQVDSRLSVSRVETLSIAELGSPFDPDLDDLTGPHGWGSQYGKSPEIVPVADGNDLDVAFQDQVDASRIVVVRVEGSGDDYAVIRAYTVESLGQLMGFARDTEGNYYLASGVDEGEMVDAEYPPNDIHRSDIVRIVKFSEEGCVLGESDVDMARGAKAADSEIIVNPMVAASSRLAYGEGRLMLVHGHNTEPDPKLDGTRHQKAIATQLDATTLVATRTSTMWASHSFDQRLIFDGSRFIELHLGDAFPRALALGSSFDDAENGGYLSYHIKGATGDNNTYTRLGSLVQSADDDFPYMALFATERETSTGSMVNGTRDLALLRVRKQFTELGTNAVDFVDTDFPSQVVTSGNEERTNHVLFLTALGEDRHVERPRLVPLEGNQFLAIWEEWTSALDEDTFSGVFAMKIDAAGTSLKGPQELSQGHHISRGDDATSLGGQAVYVTGSHATHELVLNLVSPDLVGTKIQLP